ncbi:MAG: alpha/beta fold hydrolase [Myxococcota bacterium]
MNPWLVALAGAATAQLLASWRMTRKHRMREPNAKCRVVEIRGSRGHHIALYRFPPDRVTFREPVLLSHGLGANRFNLDFNDDGHGSPRLSLARYLHHHGFDVWMLETRGSGRAKVPWNARWSLLDEARDDVGCALESVLSESKVDRVFWVGHSKGGLLQLLHQALNLPTARHVAGIVVVGTPGSAPAFNPLLRPMLRLAAGGISPGLPLIPIARLALPWASPLTTVGRSLMPHLQGLPTPMMKKLFASLPSNVSPAVLSELAKWTLEGRIVTEDGVPIELTHVSVPCLFIAGGRDWLAPLESVRAGFEAIGSADKTFVEAGSESGVMYGHGGLLLGSNAPEDVFPVIRSWLSERACTLIADPTASRPCVT